eukprot:CAMPEP_0197626732 /NCGR_PEP_ID=MMETSP1338-20131121/5563_1 /TAXON_ID=43686 ORGANISM="Pelagodinium beii, Strain RCC1491" /NCGR_SAMPLE_ID=MMETSP1338 /ASSEMBLY_ACC=CAM_ASM_000754 /LENGTH=855 /DNA_ID=CAMNT_0043197287 /DNA_START=66 /DNA_END=2633 /DNA_ORIENTATION=-
MSTLEKDDTAGKECDEDNKKDKVPQENMREEAPQCVTHRLPSEASVPSVRSDTELEEPQKTISRQTTGEQLAYQMEILKTGQQTQDQVVELFNTCAGIHQDMTAMALQIRQLFRETHNRLDRLAEMSLKTRDKNVPMSKLSKGKLSPQSLDILDSYGFNRPSAHLQYEAKSDSSDNNDSSSLIEVDSGSSGQEGSSGGVSPAASPCIPPPNHGQPLPAGNGPSVLSGLPSAGGHVVPQRLHPRTSTHPTARSLAGLSTARRKQVTPELSPVFNPLAQVSLPGSQDEGRGSSVSSSVGGSFGSILPQASQSTPSRSRSGSPALTLPAVDEAEPRAAPGCEPPNLLFSDDEEENARARQVARSSRTFSVQSDMSSQSGRSVIAVDLASGSSLQLTDIRRANDDNILGVEAAAEEEEQDVPAFHSSSFFGGLVPEMVAEEEEEEEEDVDTIGRIKAEASRAMTPPGMSSAKKKRRRSRKSHQMTEESVIDTAMKSHSTLPTLLKDSDLPWWAKRSFKMALQTLKVFGVFAEEWTWLAVAYRSVIIALNMLSFASCIGGMTGFVELVGGHADYSLLQQPLNSAARHTRWMELVISAGACFALPSTGITKKALDDNIKITEALQAAARMRKFGSNWARQVGQDFLVFLLVLISALTLRVLSSDFTSWYCIMRLVLFTLSAGTIAAAAFGSLFWSRGLQCMIDSFLICLAHGSSVARSERSWKWMSALMRRMSSLNQLCLTLLAGTAALSAASILMDAANGHRADLLPYVILIMYVPSVLWNSATLTDACKRVPPVVSSLCSHRVLDKDTLYLVQLIHMSEAGLYVYDTQLTRGIVQKFVYFTVVALCFTATNIFEVSLSA